MKCTFLRLLVIASCMIVGASLRAEGVKLPHILAVPTLTISGQTSFNAWLYRNNKTFLSGSSTVQPWTNTGYGGGPLFTMEDARLRFTVEGKTDLGMKYGFIMVLDGDTSASKTLRENYLFAEGSWGKVFLGDTYGVLSTMAFGGYDQWGGTKFMEGNAPSRVANLTTGVFRSVNLVGDTNRDTKVTYLTPRWNGFQLGATYTPRSEHRGEASVNSLTSTVSPRKPFDINNIASGVNFIHKFLNGFEMALSGTSVVARTKPEYVGAPKRNSVIAYAFGGTFSYDHIGFSCEYGNNGRSQEIAGQKLSNAGQFLDFGLAYRWGPTKFSTGYYYSWRKALGGGVQSNYTSVSATMNAVSAAVDHKVAPGMLVYFEYANFMMKNPAAVDEANRMNTLVQGQYVGSVPNNRANAFVLGSRLVF